MTEDDPANEGQSFMTWTTLAILLVFVVACIVVGAAIFIIIRWVGFANFSVDVFWFLLGFGFCWLINWARRT